MEDRPIGERLLELRNMGIAEGVKPLSCDEINAELDGDVMEKCECPRLRDNPIIWAGIAILIFCALAYFYVSNEKSKLEAAAFKLGQSYAMRCAK